MNASLTSTPSTACLSSAISLAVTSSASGRRDTGPTHAGRTRCVNPGSFISCSSAPGYSVKSRMFIGADSPPNPSSRSFT